MSKLESDIDKPISNWCKDNDILWIKFNPFGSRGWPDRIAIFPTGIHVWVELKRSKKLPKKLQTHRLYQLNKQGALAVWFDDSFECIAYLKEIMDQINEMDT